MTSEAAHADFDEEDVFVFPDSWLKHVHPRRGGVATAVAALDPDAPAAADAAVAAVDWLGDALRNFGSSSKVVQAIRRTLAGDAVPLGAAALALAVEAAPNRNEKRRPTAYFADAWVQRHGIAFAVEAALRMDGLFAGPDQSPQLNLVVAGPGRFTNFAPEELEIPRRLRAILAVCGDADYATAVATLGELRGCCAQCAVTAGYLAPSETEWVTESCRVFPPVWTSASYHYRCTLLFSLSTKEQVELLGENARLFTHRLETEAAVTAVDGLGIEALPVFADCLSAEATADTVRAAREIVVRIPGDDAFRFLTDRLGQPHVAPAVRQAAALYPRRAIRLLAEAVLSGGPHSQVARDLLAPHVRGRRGLAEAVAAGLPDTSSALVAELLAVGEQKPTASAESLPALLVSPPWRRKQVDAPKSAPIVVTGLRPPDTTRVTWTRQERDALAARSRREFEQRWNYADRAPSVAGQFDDCEAKGLGVVDGDNAYQLFRYGPLEPQIRDLIRRWRPGPRSQGAVEYDFGRFLERFDADAVPAGCQVARSLGPKRAAAMLLPILDIDVARLMADWLVRLKTGRACAQAWLDRHGADAALLLVPDAVGQPGKARDAAEAALRYLAGSSVDGIDALTEAEYGPEAAAAIREILATDPVERAALVPPPALPDWLAPETLPQVLLRGRELALPGQAVEHLLTAFALSAPDVPYPGVDKAVEALDPASLADFAWSVFVMWRMMGHPVKESWTLTCLGLVGDDETVRRLTPVIKAWPGESGHHRAVAGLDVLTAIGTDTALRRLNEISQRVQFKALKERAVQKIAQIASDLGLTAEQLADRLVPDLGLDEEGGLWLDYGPRRFRAAFDEHLKPFITDESGARRKDLPAPNAKDDAELAASARKRYSALKKEARLVGTDQIARLEAAMVTGRSWSAEEFRELLLGHPLLSHLVRRLVWVAEHDGTREGFRVAEDRTSADVADRAYRLPADAAVWLAHPLTWPEGLAAWGEIFADYEILQPFSQLGREVYALEDTERAAHRLARFEAVTLPVGKILGLTKNGWLRSPAQDNGIENCITKKLGADLYLVLDLDDGIQVGMVNESPDQTLEAVYLSAEAEVYHQGQWDNGLRFADLDPVTVSELLRELTMLVS